MNLLSQVIIRKPIVPVLIKDQNTALLVLLFLAILSTLALYKIMRYYNEWVGHIEGLLVWDFYGQSFNISPINLLSASFLWVRPWI